MGSFARKQKRKCLQAWKKGEHRAVKDNVRAYQVVHHATAKEIILYETAKLEAVSNLMVFIDVAMKKAFHFGKERLLRLRKKMHAHVSCIKTGYVTAEDIEGIIRREVHMDLHTSPNFSQWDLERRANYTAVRDISVAFCIALLDEFGWKQKRIDRAYRAFAAVGTLMNQHKVDMQELKAERNRKPKEPETQASKLIDEAIGEVMAA